MAIDMGKLQHKRDHFIAHNLRNRCIKTDFEGIHHRFVNDPEFRASQLEHDRNEEVCIKMDELAQKDISNHMKQAEYFRYRKNWWISLNNLRTSGPLRDRSDFNEALSTFSIYTKNLEKYQKKAPIIEFFLQLVAMERFLVEPIIIQMKVHK